MLCVAERQGVSVEVRAKGVLRMVTRYDRTVRPVYLPRSLALSRVTIAAVTMSLRSVDKIGRHNRLSELVVRLWLTEW